MSTSKSVSKAEQAQALEYIRETVKPGDTVYCILRHVSASGMSRVIDLKVIIEHGGEHRIGQIGWNAARALGMTYDRQRNGIRISGTGFDAGDTIVQDLSDLLYPGAEQRLRREWL